MRWKAKESFWVRKDMSIIYFCCNEFADPERCRNTAGNSSNLNSDDLKKAIGVCRVHTDLPKVLMWQYSFLFAFHTKTQSLIQTVLQTFTLKMVCGGYTWIHKHTDDIISCFNFLLYRLKLVVLRVFPHIFVLHRRSSRTHGPTKATVCFRVNAE